MTSRSKRAVTVLLLLLATGLLRAESLAELFARVKAKVAARAYPEGLVALSELEAEAQKPENEAARAALAPAAAFYRGVCLAGIGKTEEAKESFAIFIAANPEKGIDRKAYGAAIVAAFQAARNTRSDADRIEETLPAMTRAYRASALLAESSALPGPDWANGPVKYLLSSSESRAYSRLSDQVSRAEFVARFWRARDPLPDTPENEFRREFERRVAFADENLSEGSTRGSMTDRGMVFVLMGPPSGVVRRPVSNTEDTPVMFPTRIPQPRSIRPPTDVPTTWRELWRYSRSGRSRGGTHHPCRRRSPNSTWTSSSPRAPTTARTSCSATALRCARSMRRNQDPETSISSYFTLAVNTSSIRYGLRHPVAGSSCRRLSVQMGWDTPP